MALNDCFYEKKDWRACKTEVSVLYNRGGTSPNRTTARRYESQSLANNILKSRWKLSSNAGSDEEMIRGQTPRMSDVLAEAGHVSIRQDAIVV